MKEILFKDKDILVMKLLHYFITEEGYNPIILRGIENEIWLENMDGPYKIIRINTGYIHNKEQFDFDIFKTKKIINKIKLKTFSFDMNVLSLFLDLGEYVTLNSLKNIDCLKVNNEDDLFSSDKIKKYFPEIENKLKFNENGIELFTKITNDINKKNMNEAKQTEEIFKEKTPYVTYSIIFLNILLFLLMYIFGNGSEDALTLLLFGGLNKDLVANGEIYRIITSAFLHNGIIHLTFNMYALYIIGKDVESFFGHVKYSIIYLLSIILGSLLSLVFSNGFIVSVGASGAIFGLMGALLFFGYNYRVTLNNSITRQIIPIILLNLFIGVMIPSIDNFAHLGGLIGGYLAAMMVGIKYKTTKSEKINSTIVIILLILFLIYMAFFKV